MKNHAPSPSTNPLRSLENGRDPRSGSSFQRVVRIRIIMKPRRISGAMGASTPPVSTHGDRPHWMLWNAWPNASVDDVHPVDMMWLGPRNPNRIDISLASVPIVDVGIVYTLHCFSCPL